jgi:long-chain fatty acid transport protein
MRLQGSFRRKTVTVAWLLCPATLNAGGFEAPGVGAKALSMGGAFVGVADDWTATYWNPAGLAQLNGTGFGQEMNLLVSKTEVGDSMANPSPPFTHQNIERGDTFLNLGGEPAHFNVPDSRMVEPLPSLGAYHRFGRWVGAMSVHIPLGFSSNVTDRTIPNLNAAYSSKGFIIMSGFSLATELGDGLLVGGGGHILSAQVERHASKSGSYDFNADFKGSDPAVPQGVFGLLWKFHPSWQLGAVYRTPATLHLKGSAEVADTRFPMTVNGVTFQNEKSDFTQEIHNPATYGVGLVYRATADWLVAADWQGTDWRPTREKIAFNTPGLILQDTDFDADWSFTNRIRLGTEYRPWKRWAFRAGVARDPQAQPDEAQSITGEVDITRYFYSAGFGWTATEKLDLDVGYEYGYGSRTIDHVDFVRQSHSVLLGFHYRFA